MYANNDKLEGIFENGDCIKGKIIYNNGNYYEGDLKDGLYDGQGLFKTA